MRTLVLVALAASTAVSIPSAAQEPYKKPPAVVEKIYWQNAERLVPPPS